MPNLSETRPFLLAAQHLIQAQSGKALGFGFKVHWTLNKADFWSDFRLKVTHSFYLNKSAYFYSSRLLRDKFLRFFCWRDSYQQCTSLTVPPSLPPASHGGSSAATTPCFKLAQASKGTQSWPSRGLLTGGTQFLFHPQAIIPVALWVKLAENPQALGMLVRVSPLM